MSEIVHKNITSYASRVTDLKKEFVKVCKDENKAVEILRQMRICHGIAICENQKDIGEINKKSENITEGDLIRISTNSSFLYIIHEHIRNCEKMLYAMKKRSIKPYQKDNEDISRNNISVNISKNADGINELSLSNMKTDTEKKIDIDTSELFSISNADNKKLEHAFFSTGGNCKQLINTNTSEYINNLTTTEAKKLFSEEKNQIGVVKPQIEKLDIYKPTIINYWGDWCGYSINFLPEWNKFKEDVEFLKQYPELQVLDFHVAYNDKEAANTAKKAGVKGYPTVILFYNNQRYSKVASNLTAKELKEFISSIIKKK